jgi:iron(III) transport system ATP-binding protein
MKDGHVDQFGPPEELLAAPRTAFVATFIGTPPANLLPVVAVEGRWTFQGRPIGPAPPGRAEAQLMYRAERTAIADEAGPDAFPAELLESVPVAGRGMLTLLAGETRVTAVVDRMVRTPIGSRLHVRLPAEPDAVFTKSGERVV